MYLCVLNGSANCCKSTGQGTALTTLWMGYNPAVLTTKVHLAKLCSSSTRQTELRFDNLMVEREQCSMLVYCTTGGRYKL